MPAYDYKCDACDQVFEVKRSLSDDSPVTCPTCEGETRRIFSPVGVVFKGSGFHNTDYKNKGGDKGGELATKPKEISDTSACGGSTSDGGACATCPAAAKE